MKPAVQATRDLIICIVLVGALSSLSWYAGTHPWFASNILLPILGVAFVVLMWLFFYTMARIK